MKKFIASLLLFCFTVVAFAESQIHDSVSKSEATKIEAVTPTLDLGFTVAVYLPLDVYAPEGQKIDYTFKETESGFTAINEKPPLQGKLIKSKARRKWIWFVDKEWLINIHSERQIT